MSGVRENCGPRPSPARGTSRSRGSVRVRTAVPALLVVVLLGACGTSSGVVDLGQAPTGSAGPSAPPPAATGTPVPAPAPTPVPTPGPTSGAVPVPGPVVSPAEPPDAPTGADVTDVVVYLVRGEQVTATSRTVERSPRIGGAAVRDLLEGPTPAEAAAGLSTQIPPATRLRGLTIADGVAFVDLSGDFESGGGTLGLTLRLAQVACTLDAFPTVDGVRFALDGTVVDVFSGDGLIIDEPVACSDYAEFVE